MVSKENEERMLQSDSCWARQLSTCCRIGSKFRCTRSTPVESVSSSEKYFECFAKTGLKSPLNARL